MNFIGLGEREITSSSSPETNSPFIISGLGILCGEVDGNHEVSRSKRALAPVYHVMVKSVQPVTNELNYEYMSICISISFVTRACEQIILIHYFHLIKLYFERMILIHYFHLF